jgi:hypothetical protein
MQGCARQLCKLPALSLHSLLWRTCCCFGQLPRVVVHAQHLGYLEGEVEAGHSKGVFPLSTLALAVCRATGMAA